MDEYKDKRIHNQTLVITETLCFIASLGGLASPPCGNCSHCPDAAEGLQAWQLGAPNIKMKILRRLTKEFFEIPLSPRFGGKESGSRSWRAVLGDGEENESIKLLLGLCWSLDVVIRARLRTVEDLNMQERPAAWFCLLRGEPALTR